MEIPLRDKRKTLQEFCVTFILEEWDSSTDKLFENLSENVFHTM